MTISASTVVAGKN